MENKIMMINNIACYEQDGTAFLNLEACARGLGFTQVKNGVEYVRWETTKSYLTEIGFSQLAGKDSFIPENIFYRLAMKAKNETAEKFQALVADEIIPSIRKRGMYATDKTIDEVLSDPDFGIRLLTELKEERIKRKMLEEKTIADAPKVLFANSVAASDQSILVGELAKLLKQNGVDIGQNRLFAKLREEGFLCSSSGDRWNTPTQRAMDLGIFEIKERTINNPDGSVRITRTTKVTGKGQIYFINRYKVCKTA